ncbi:MAG: TlpA family protein disulfide reductase [Alcaligenaceae bacterium]|nr:MAG: TlpA family protein disulfide reductase [Alcaligenaceae bacterium]
MGKSYAPAPSLQVSRWLNASHDLTLESLRGRVVVLHFFQMLCPACVSHGLPQAKRTHKMFSASDVTVMGLHSVFEHHDAMTPVALEAFSQEYRLTFPIGIDAPSQGSIPQTMREYALHGTPSIVLIDRLGRVRLSRFGSVDDMAVGAAIGQLLAEPGMSGRDEKGALSSQAVDSGGCAAKGCRTGAL